jgi:hypothetical protein
VWDLVFGTHARVERVLVPRKQAEKLPWLLEAGRLRPELAADWEVPAPRGESAAAK